MIRQNARRQCGIYLLLLEMEVSTVVFSVSADSAALDGSRDLKGANYMPNQDKHYTIYLRSAKMSVPCTKQQFDDYYRDINAYRRTQMNHGRCICPKSEWLYCDMDCGRCPHQTAGDMSSLDDGLIDDEGNEMNRLDHLQEKMPELQCPAFAEGDRRAEKDFHRSAQESQRHSKKGVS